MWRRLGAGLALLTLLALLPGCGDSGYRWSALPEEEQAVGAAREMDAQIAGVWADYSDALVMHFIFNFCAGLEEAEDVAAYLDGRAEEQGEAVLLPLVVGSPNICPARREEVSAWISERAGSGG